MTAAEIISALSRRPADDAPRDDANAVYLPTPWSERAGLVVKQGFEPREQFSASQLETAECMYKWGLRYLWGLRRYQFPWAAFAAGQTPEWAKSSRSSAFGTEGHKRLELYFTGQPTNWTDDVGRAALMGLSYLPTEGPVLVEQPIVFDSSMVLHLDDPVRFVGYEDLLTAETTYDHKFTTDPKRWAKTADELVQNGAANLYALSDMNKIRASGVGLGDARRMRWVYMASRGDPFARPVEFVIERDSAERVARAMVIQAVTLRQEIRAYLAPWGPYHYDASPSCEAVGLSINHLPRNTGLCKKFGGCEYHHTIGGPCQAELAPSSILIPASKLLDGVVTQQRKESTEMATLKERLAAAETAAQAGGVAPQTQAPPAAGFAPPAQGFAATPAAAGFPPAAPLTLAALPQGFPAAIPPAPPPGVPPQFAGAQAAGVPPPGVPAPAFAGFPPAAAPAPAQVNPPEAAAVFPPAAPPPIPVAVASAPPVATTDAPKKRGRKSAAQKAAEAAAAGGLPSGVVDLHGQEIPMPDGPDDLWTVTLCATRSDGTRLEVPASPDLSDQVLAMIAASAKGIIG